MNTKTTHSPGPWAINSMGDKTVEIRTNTKICRISNVIAYMPADDPDDKANARLIAAAPELLAACRELLNCIDPARDWSEAKAARAAIAKAEGRAAE